MILGKGIELTVEEKVEDVSLLTFNFTSQTGLTLPICLTQSAANAVTVNWGDGSPVETSADLSTSFSHTYASEGEYVVRIDCEDGESWNAGRGSFGLLEQRDGMATQICPALIYVVIDNKARSLGDSAFCGCTSLTSVRIGNGVTSIGSSAFSYCTSLTSVTIPDGVTSIGSYAFNGCASLKSVTIPDSVTSIGDLAFLNCTSLTSIEIPDSVTSIGDSAFQYCTALTSIEIPDSVTSIGMKAFSNCSSLEIIVVEEGNPTYHSDGNCLIETKTKTLIAGCKNSIIPSDGSVTSIGRYAFEYCTSLTSIIIPDSVTSIGRNAFYGCTSLNAVHISDVAAWCGISFDYYSNPLDYAKNLYLNGELVTDLIIPVSVTSIGNKAFDGCTSLTSVTIPDSVTEIGDSAFSGCRSLKSAMIGNGVTSIAISAFYMCRSLTSVTIGSSVTVMSRGTFGGCSKLKSITCKAVTPPTIDSLTFQGVPSNCNIYVPSQSVENYKQAQYWTSRATYIQAIPQE